MLHSRQVHSLPSSPAGWHYATPMPSSDGSPSSPTPLQSGTGPAAWPIVATAASSMMATAAADTRRRGKGKGASSSKSNGNGRNSRNTRANANINAKGSATGDGKASIQGPTSTASAPNPATSASTSTSRRIHDLHARARSLRVRPDPRTRKIDGESPSRAEPKEAVQHKEAVWRAFQLLSGHCKTQALVCPWTGTAAIKRAHMLSHSMRREYRSKFWLRMLGFEDHLSNGTLADATNVVPLAMSIHKWLDKAHPRAIIYPSEATSIAAVRLAEEALARQEASQDDFTTTSGDFLEGWPSVHTVDGEEYRYFEYHLGLCVSDTLLEDAMVGLKKDGRQPGLVAAAATDAGRWPLQTEPEVPKAVLPLDLTTMQLMLVNWVAKGLGQERRPLSPVLRRALDLADYRLALLESATTAQWRGLKRPNLPFARPPIPTMGPIQDKGRHYIHRRSRAPPPSTQESDFSSSPPVNYRTGSIFECLSLQPSSSPVAVEPPAGIQADAEAPAANIQTGVEGPSPPAASSPQPPRPLKRRRQDGDEGDEGDDDIQRRHKRLRSLDADEDDPFGAARRLSMDLPVTEAEAELRLLEDEAARLVQENPGLLWQHRRLVEGLVATMSVRQQEVDAERERAQAERASFLWQLEWEGRLEEGSQEWEEAVAQWEAQRPAE